RHLQPGALLLLWPVEQLGCRIQIDLLLEHVTRPMALVLREIARIGGDPVQGGQFAFAAVRRPRIEAWVPRLIPKRNAGIIILPLVPTGALVIGVLIRGNPAEMFEADLDSALKNNRIMNVPSV